MISIIVAVSTNNVIGSQGGLPWRLSDDLKRFKQLTMGKPVVMGRLTYESIGKPLPGRQNIIMTRRKNYVADGCDVVASPEAAIATARSAAEIMVIGGGEIYRHFMPRVQRIYLTRVHATVDGDTHFAALDAQSWQQVAADERCADDHNSAAVSYQVWNRLA